MQAHAFSQHDCIVLAALSDAGRSRHVLELEGDLGSSERDVKWRARAIQGCGEERDRCLRAIRQGDAQPTALCDAKVSNVKVREKPLQPPKRQRPACVTRNRTKRDGGIIAGDDVTDGTESVLDGSMRCEAIACWHERVGMRHNFV